MNGNNENRITATINPAGSLDLLSRYEVSRLLDKSQGGLYELFRRCALAVINCGSDNDDSRQIFEEHENFDIEILERRRGLKLRVINAPCSAFVDGVMIRGIREHLFAVLRDIIYTHFELEHNLRPDLSRSPHITNTVFHILRNARMLVPGREPNLAVCWGGHSISREEYDYSKAVGHELGLRQLDVCTGCGPGAMKGPMKGATIAHAKQRTTTGRYIGISEPGIIAAESPNPIVNDLVIMPDIEKRLEAFIRLGHGIVVFPGGVGTAEEIIYLLGILLHPKNRKMPFPLIFTGPPDAAAYFEQIDRFIVNTLGEPCRELYRIIIGDPVKVARKVHQGMERVRRFRRKQGDAYYFNWQLHTEKAFQTPFRPSHNRVASLDLHHDQPVHQLAANLRRAFSAIVSGNVKDEGIRSIERHGPFEISGDRHIMAMLDDLLRAFVAQGRMKIAGDYEPCYRIVT